MQEKERIDKLIAEKYELSRNDASFLIEQGKVYLDKKQIKKTHSKIDISDLNKIKIDKNDIENLEVLKQKENIENKDKMNNNDLNEFKNIELPVIYEDENILIIDKPKGLVVYSGVGKEVVSVSNILNKKYSLSNLNGENRKGIVHRLDKDTSGLLLLAKNNEAHKYFQKLFKMRKIKKEYIALVKGSIQETKGKIDMPIARSKKDFKKMEAIKGGKEAITYFEVLERFQNYTLVKINIETGRTHQIRVHFSKIGYPIVGDKKYSRGKNDFNLDSQALHASGLEFINMSNKKIEVKSDIPKEFENILKILRLNNK